MDAADIVFFALLIMCWVALGGFGPWIAVYKGRNPREGALLGFLGGPFGVLLEALLPTVGALRWVHPSRLDYGSVHDEIDGPRTGISLDALDRNGRGIHLGIVDDSGLTDGRRPGERLVQGREGPVLDAAVRDEIDGPRMRIALDALDRDGRKIHLGIVDDSGLTDGQRPGERSAQGREGPVLDAAKLLRDMRGPTLDVAKILRDMCAPSRNNRPGGKTNAWGRTEKTSSRPL